MRGVAAVGGVFVGATLGSAGAQTDTRPTVGAKPVFELRELKSAPRHIAAPPQDRSRAPARAQAAQ